MRGSGKLSNPGKHFFMKLTAASVKMVNTQPDGDNLLYIQKAMVRCELVSNLSGVWEEAQLFPHVQDIA